MESDTYYTPTQRTRRRPQEAFQDVQYATLLSEMAYRAAECSDDASWKEAKSSVEAELGCFLPEVQRHRSGGQRYLVGETETAIYVAFQGTKHAADWLANLNFIHAPLWHHRQRTSGSRTDGSSNSSSWSSAKDPSSRSARAHVGFIRRANQSALSITALQQSAAAAGKRLVLTGHSLGGAVATLTTVRLLRSLHTLQPLGDSSHHADPQIRCISFATPAVANTDLLQEVAEAGWDEYITNIVLPEDPVVPFVNLLLKAPAHPAAASSSIQPLSCHIAQPMNSNLRGMAIRPLSRSSSTDSLTTVYGYYEQPQVACAVQPSTAAPWGGLSPHYRLSRLQCAQVSVTPYLCVAETAAGARSSDELVSWLYAARGAVQQQRLGLHGCVGSDGSDMHYSGSSNSLSSMQSSLTDSSNSWGTASSLESLSAVTGRLEATVYAASAVATQLFVNSPSTSTTHLASHTDQFSPTKWLCRFGISKASLAFLTGALAAGMRCAAAVTAPQLFGQQLSMLSILPRAFSAPLAVAAVHVMGSLWLKSAVPVSHPLGQQWVMTRDGMEKVVKPLKAYPRDTQGLGLQQLGGFAPGHRMIAYRRRVVDLIRKDQQ